MAFKFIDGSRWTSLLVLCSGSTNSDHNTWIQRYTSILVQQILIMRKMESLCWKTNSSTILKILIMKGFYISNTKRQWLIFKLVEVAWYE